MGQKVNPHGLRVGVIKDWDSRWYASEEKVGDLIVEDQKIRKFLKKTLYGAGVPRIEIERSNDVVTIFLHCARPGMVIGQGGKQIEEYRQALEKMIGKKTRLNIVEVKNPDMDAQLVAENIAQQLEKRISHRRAMKNAMARAMRAGAKGIKTCCSGRLGGREIAGVEHYHEGTIPLQTIRADIEYGFAEAATTFGRIGVKVWIYKGEVLSQTLRTTPRTMDTSKPYQERRERRRRDDRRGGGFNRDRQGGGFSRDRQGAPGGGFNRDRQGAPGGGFNRDRQGAPGGGFNRDRQGGGFNRQGAPGGGFNRDRQGGGFNRQGAPGRPAGMNRQMNAPRPSAAPAPAPEAPAPKEGGAE
ncbi:MAG: 30S ribosomal protein S3 [Oscillibacter sp.]|nr:30S ribosomal protein S3 [Oscillibacter sp.]